MEQIDDKADLFVGRHVSVSRETAEVFGRPAGVRGSFADSGQSDSRPAPAIRPPDPVLAEAFSRPAGEPDSLQRDPLASYGVPDEPPARADPWRDPDSTPTLDRPALSVPVAPEPTLAGPKLGVREVLFGNRISWWALGTLAMIALLIGLVGGLLGRWTAEVAAPLHSNSVKLHQSGGGGDQPRSQVAAVARAVEKSAVSIDIRTASAYANGSGFVIDAKGYILTNNHVVSMAANDRSAKLEVVFSDRTRVPGRIVGRDVRTDLAVVKVDKIENLTVSKLGNSDKLQIGEDVVAFGSPLGLDRTVTSGIVSAMNRPVPLKPDAESDTDAVIDAIQTDAAINPGNSGGPLVNGKAEVVGVNTAGLVPGGGSIGLGFAIPINQALPIAKALIADGKVNHPQIGINASSVRNERVLGAQVRNVVAGGAADRAGVRENDVIISFNNRTIESADELTVAVRTSKIGEKVPFTYWRDGRTFKSTITPGSD
ncbi:S1C family serine protease [Gordonia sp. (in: high G+C Gram-positive bacteria)]|mgnify:CR=1 FL=1|uniref:S1C family serine protease n=1 Tax=Gordonia sp. (in: high G+C Gram-positive bacteria) TaxID=84139 RepID=UPI00261A4796|nr:trypsin-like peptidase domain-containing protein [Gordonia sp. (in: high G+C Gram-positive bacteria)]HMS77386.1 trypsin-like peptidase domain-containing protein [Gordonia sp. (in: high G+C Gram-positive bacteria)]